MKLLTALIVACIAPMLFATERITLYSHYDFPPFWRADGYGLTQELAHRLSEQSKGAYQFEVQITPRKRIDLLLEDPKWQGIIPWVSPIWFRDETKTHYAWSGVIMHDADLVLSYQAFNYTNPESMSGKTLGGILGHRYAEFEALISSGRIVRDDAPNQDMNLKKLQARRVDFVFIPHSSWIELRLSTPAAVAGLYAASTPRNRYERLILISPNQTGLIKFINKAVDEMAKDPKWQNKIRQYSYIDIAP
ncbi:transporter substrate-binding domain-containing protein [Chitinibacter sp. SCUT-21]|uniref:substrate-binding periplasmic protein n=1 Tax=Chitinibacter sp. SCUT-21 TaxID=2970891 RepID=UPI0035A699A7